MCSSRVVVRITTVVSNGCDPDPRVLREAKWLVEAGHDVTIHAFDRSENLPKVQQYAGIKIVRHRVGITPYGSYFRTLIGLQKFRKSVAKEIQDSDVLLCHDADTLHLVNKFTGPTVFDMHDLHHTWVLMKNPSSILRRIISNRMKNSMLKRAKKTTKVITSSSGFSDWLSNYQIHSIPIENRPINNGPIDCNCAFTVGYFGRIREPRSFELLFESVQRIEQQCRPKILIAGGQENMSLAPHAIHLRDGKKLGDAELIDTMIKDGLWDAFHGYHMGVTAENVAEKFQVTREEQDKFSLKSQEKALKAQKENKFKDEIINFKIKSNKAEINFNKDEHPREGINLESLTRLKPVFKKDGTVTAGNASGINDGAAAVILMSEEEAEKRNLKKQN